MPPPLQAWCHYIAFDTLAGLWIAQNSVKAGVNALVLVPVLLLTLLVGPTGLVAYLIIRTLFGGSSATSSARKKQQ